MSVLRREEEWRDVSLFQYLYRCSSPCNTHHIIRSYYTNKTTQVSSLSRESLHIMFVFCTSASTNIKENTHLINLYLLNRLTKLAYFTLGNILFNVSLSNNCLLTIENPRPWGSHAIDSSLFLLPARRRMPPLGK
jgi:hypothetical protein